MRKEKKRARADEKCHMSWESKNRAMHALLPSRDSAGDISQLVTVCNGQKVCSLKVVFKLNSLLKV